MRSFILCILVLIGNVQLTKAQKANSLQKAFDGGQYMMVVSSLSESDAIKNNADLLFLRGKAYLELGLTDQSFSDLARAKTLGIEDNTLNLYLAKNYHSQGRYKDAIKWYKTYLSGLGKRDKTDKEAIYSAISQCVNSELIPNDDAVIVEHAVGAINTIHDEIRPIFSRNTSNLLYYTSSTPQTSEIAGMAFTNGEWSESVELPKDINAKKTSKLFDLSGDGQVMFFENTLDQNTYSLYNKSTEKGKNYFFQAPYFPHLGDCDLQIIDARTFIFSSKRPDSYGGYDIYLSMLVNGMWAEPINLGEAVNSASDERSPFMTSDKQVLYFSSDRSGSLGGFDIFNSTKSKAKQTWNSPTNIGTPVNSASDDLHFRVDANGLRAVMSSSRPGGKGGLDIYSVYFNTPIANEIVDATHLEYIRYEADLDIPTDTNQVDNAETISNIAETSKSTVKEKTQETEIHELSDLEVDKLASSSVEKSNTKKDSKAPQTPDTKAQKTTKQSSIVSTESKNLESTRTSKTSSSIVETAPRPAPNPDIDLDVNYDYALSSKQRVPTIYYKDEDDLFSVLNRDLLDSLAVLINSMPKEVKVELTNYTHKAARREYELFFAINEMDKIVDYLDDKDVKTDRLIINSVGSSFPLAQTYQGGKELQEYIDANQRIEVTFYNLPNHISVDYISNDIPASRKARKYPLYRTVKDDLHYRVIFAETDKVFKNIILSYYDDIIITKDYKLKKYTYSVGFNETYEGAMVLQNELAEKNITETKIVPYIGSIPLSSKEAIVLSTEYPTLKSYINRN